MKTTSLPRCPRFPVLALCLLFLSIPSWIPAQDAKPRIVIDASRDGGAWWFPQKEKQQDASQAHEGKALADYLKTLTPDVVELPHGEVITDKLKNAAVVIRFNACDHPYSHEEGVAYKKYVENGGRVLLLYGTPEKGAPDEVAEHLGIRVGQRVETPFIKKWANHPITTGLKDVPFHCGSVISGYPESSIQLGMMANGQSVFGMATVGEGKLIYLGSVAPMISVSQPFVDNVIRELLRK